MATAAASWPQLQSHRRSTGRKATEREEPRPQGLQPQEPQPQAMAATAMGATATGAISTEATVAARGPRFALQIQIVIFLVDFVRQNQYFF